MSIEHIRSIIARIDAERDAITQVREHRVRIVNGSHTHIEGSTPPFIPAIKFGSHPEEVSSGL